MTASFFSRRHFLRASAALAVASAFSRILPAQAADMTVGFIYVGPRDDFDYNQAHAAAAALIEQMPASR